MRHEVCAVAESLHRSGPLVFVGHDVVTEPRESLSVDGLREQCEA